MTKPEATTWPEEDTEIPDMLMGDDEPIWRRGGDFADTPWPPRAEYREQRHVQGARVPHHL